MAKQQTPYKMTKLSEIRPYDRNPRVIPQAAVDAVAKSIAAYGFRQPIVVDGHGVILAGHTRYRAAQQLGLAEVPVVWQTDITDIQARGYRIADNKTAEIAAWDRDALDAEVRELAGMDDGALASLGMSDWELDRILHECTADDPLEEIRANGPTPGASPATVGTHPPMESNRPNATVAADGFSFDAGPDESESPDGRFRLSIIFKKKKDLDEFLDNNRAELVDRFGCNIAVGAV